MTEEKQPFKECGCNTDVCKCECHKQNDKDQLDFWKDTQ